MPKYRYQAKDLEGKKHSGVLEAADTSDLYNRLRAKSLTLVSSSEAEEKVKKYKMKAPELAEFSRQMGDMLSSGLTVIKALGILKDRDFKPALKEVYDTLYRNIQNGMTLSESLRSMGKTFPDLFVNMYASGEAGGQLDVIAKKMAEHYDKEHRLNSKVKSALMYPKILGVVTIVVTVIIFTFVLPTFFTLFQDMKLPLITRIVVAISNILIHYGFYILIGILLLALLWQYLLRTRVVRRKFDQFKLHVPIMGKLLKIIYTARFAQGLSSLYTSGIPLITTMGIASTLVGNAHIEDQMPAVIQDIRNGEALSAAMKKVDGFDSKLVSTIFIGEESGRLGPMLESVANSYNFEAEAATGRLVALLEPVMIVTMAVIIGSIMIAVMLPIFSLYQNIQ